MERKKEQERAEQRREDEKWRRREHKMGQGAVAIAGVFGAYQLAKAWQEYKENKAKEKEKRVTMMKTKRWRHRRPRSPLGVAPARHRANLRALHQ